MMRLLSMLKEHLCFLRSVELHIHGAGQFGFECITQPAELLQVSQFLESKGIGCFVPTMLWNENP